MFFLGQEIKDYEGVVSKCIVVVKQQWFVLPQLSSLLARWVKHAPHDLIVDFLIDRLAQWQELVVINAFTSKNTINMTSTLLLSSGSVTSETPIECSGPWLRSRTQKSVSSPVMILRGKFGPVWRHWMMSWRTWMQSTFWSVSSNLGTNFAQTFHVPESSVAFQTLSFFVSRWFLIIRNSQLTIATQQLFYSLDIHLTPTCWKPLAPEIIFTALTSLNFFYHSKTRSREYCLGSNDTIWERWKNLHTKVKLWKKA